MKIQNTGNVFRRQDSTAMLLLMIEKACRYEYVLQIQAWSSRNV